MSTKARIQPGDGDPRHGTTNGYTNLGCRCQLCRDANTAYCLHMREVRALRLADLPDELHGRYSTYTNYSCRCDRCRRANADYAQIQDERRRSGAAR